MGAWDELDTNVSVEVNTDDLDSISDLDDPYGIFEPAIKYAENLKKGIHEGSKRGVYEIATKIRSYQEQAIRDTCDNPSGRLASSINIEDDAELTYGFTIGTIINHIYPMSVEYGRGPVYPVRAKALAFYYDGELIFRKSVGPARPRPFVAPAYDKASQLAEELMLREVNHGIDRYK